MVTEHEVAQVKREATVRAARAVGLDAELMSLDEIPETLSIENPTLATALTEFLEAYDAWFRFQQHVEREKLHGKLPSHEQNELTQLIERKEKARRKLVSLVEMPTERLASVWVREAVNPILRQLSIEIPRLQGRQWTWRYYSQRCELIEPLGVAGSQLIQGESILLADVRSLLLDHDKRLAEFLDRLNTAQNAIETDERFVAGVNELLQEHLESHREDRPWGADRREAMPRIVAQFLLNNTEDLSEGSSTMHRFWNSHRLELRQLVSDTLFNEVISAGEQLLRTAVNLERATLALRGRLCRTYGLSPEASMAEWDPGSF